jgi:UDP-glucose 4-epimerase
MGMNVAITGVNGYFAGTLLRRLESDPGIQRVVGIDVTPWQGGFGKVAFHRRDVRDPEIGGLLGGMDAVVHLAFVVEEIHDKRKTHEINVGGSRNVFEACAAASVPKIVYASSVAAYGAHPRNLLGITEDRPLAPNADSYYSLDKAAVERYLNQFVRSNPDITVTILRPPVIVGPNVRNFFAEVMRRRWTFFMVGSDPMVQFLHEEDLGEALHLAVKRDLPGVYNLGPDDHMPLSRIREITGARQIDLPACVLKPLSDLLFALRLERMSSGWLSLMEHSIVVRSEKFRRATGWQPRCTTEAALRDFLSSTGQGP